MNTPSRNIHGLKFWAYLIISWPVETYLTSSSMAYFVGIKIVVPAWQSTDIWIQFVHPGRYVCTGGRNIRTTFARDTRETYALHSHYIRTRAQKNRRGANESTFAPHLHYIRTTFTLDSHYIRAGFALHSHGTAVWHTRWISKKPLFPFQKNSGTFLYNSYSEIFELQLWKPKNALWVIV